MNPHHVLVALMSSLMIVTTGCTGEQQPPPREEAQLDSTERSATPAIIDHTVMTLGGEMLDLRSFRGRPMLIVNTASECGYTPQYAGLQKLHETYHEQGLVVIGFPSNDFGNQEPGTAQEIATFCRINYGVTFPMMAKVHTKGPKQAPIYRTLTAETDESFRGEIRWNFTKFLVDPEGRVAARFESGTEPLDERMTSAIEAMLEPRGSDSSESDVAS